MTIHNGDMHTMKHYQLFGVLTFSCWIGALFFFYTLMINRLYMTFKETSYRLSHESIIFYLITMTILVLCNLLWYGLIVVYKFNGNNYTQTISKVNSLCMLGCVVGNMLIGYTIIFMFVKKLLLLMYSVTNGELNTVNNVYSVSSESDANNIRYQSYSTKILHIITKVTLLSVIACTAFQPLFIWTIITDYIGVEHYLSMTVTWMLRVVASFVEIFMVFLTFPFNQNIYDFVCYKCHRKCFETFSKIAQKKVHKDSQADVSYVEL